MKKTNSFSENINFAEVFEAALLNNEEEVADIGISKIKIEEFSKKLELVKKSNSEQEQLKAQLKLKTKELNENYDDLKGLLKKYKKFIKGGYPQEKWIEFGIDAKK